MTVFSVSQLNRYIGFQLKSDRNLRGIMIRGEISNFTLHARSGHCYFTLRDDTCAVKAVMFASHAQALKFMPADGMSVLALASVSVYERDGVYQLYVTDLQPDGVGATYLAFAQLKEKLSALGYFDEANKKPLPVLPRRIGVITSLSGAALQDIIHVLSRRYPIGTLQLFPALVQGEAAPQSIADAINRAGKSACDVLIVGRGGGSIEDLGAFNTELVAKAIFTCPVPIISAVGHETDYTIADFTADFRAPTPSAAAEQAAPDVSMLQARLHGLEERAQDAVNAHLEDSQRWLARLTAKLEKHAVHNRVALYTERYTQLRTRLHTAMRNHLAQRETTLIRQISQLEGLSPMRVLLRGYALAYRGDALIAHAAEVQPGDSIRIRVSDGEVLATVQEIRPASKTTGAN